MVDASNEHDIERLAFQIIRDNHCSVCDRDVIQAVTDEWARRIGAFNHARMCMTLKKAGIEDG